MIGDLIDESWEAPVLLEARHGEYIYRVCNSRFCISQEGSGWDLFMMRDDDVMEFLSTKPTKQDHMTGLDVLIEDMRGMLP